MRIDRPIRRLKSILIATFILMILMRLIWMDLRVYDIRIQNDFMASLQESDWGGKSCLFKSKDTLMVPSNFPQANASPGWGQSSIFRQFQSLSCNDGVFSIATYVRLNQGLLIFSIVICLLLCRLYCRSWLMTLALAAILLSRGRLIAMNGLLSDLSLTMALASLWVLCNCHWLRTGDRFSFLFGWIVLAFLLNVEPALWLIAFSLSLAIILGIIFRKYTVRPALQQLRMEQLNERRLINPEAYNSSHKAGENQQRLVQTLSRIAGWVRPEEWEYKPLSKRMQTGSTLQPLDIPFVVWAYHKKRWRRLLFLSSLAALATILFTFSLLVANQAWSSWSWTSLQFAAWAADFIAPVDVDLIVAFGLILYSMSQRATEGLLSFWEGVWVFITSLVLGALGLLIWDHIYIKTDELVETGAMISRSASEFFLWFEPIIISMGFLGVYNLLRLLDRRIQSLAG